MTPANFIKATPGTPSTEGSLTPSNHKDEDLDLERQCHDILVNDGGRPWYSIEHLEDVSRNPEKYRETLSFWQCTKSDWMVFARQLQRWLDFRDWQRRNRKDVGLHAYGEAMVQRLSQHEFTGTFQLKEDPPQQDELTTWIEYLNYECWWQDRVADNVKHWQQRYDDAWEKLVDSNILRPSEAEGTIISEECAARRASEQGATQRAVDLARLASRSRPDTANEPPRLIKRRNGLITEFMRAAWHYWVAETNVERHSILLRWTLEQARLMEVKSSGSKSMDYTSGSQDTVRNGSPKTNIEVPGSPFQSNSACACEKISWVESRKPTDDSERSNRQSLPSISELVSGAKSSFYPPTPCSSLQPDNSLPSLLTSTPRPKPEIEKPSSLQTAHSALLFSPQQDALPATDSPRVPFSGLSSLPPASGRRPGPSPELPPPHHDPGPPKPPEPPRPFNEAYAHPLPAPQALVYYQPDQLPPGQMPLLAYPISPRHAIPAHAAKLYDPGLVRHSEEEDSSARARKDETVKRYFDSSIYEDLLSRLGSLSRTILNFAEDYSRIALEQHGAHGIPKRLPTEREVSNMLGSIELMKRWLEKVRDLVETSIQNQKAGGRTGIKGPCEEEHGVLTSEDRMMPQRDTVKYKKWRRLALTPGRCRRCNRIDTPEWRRDPDGAKLKRKRQLEARRMAQAMKSAASVI